MVALSALFQQKSPLKILVAGDLLLDRYTIGSTNRISPESPVPVVNVQKEEQRAGGAGNVMLNLRALGANVVALGRVGCDSAGEQLKEALQLQGIDTKLLVTDIVPTSVKQRIIAQGQQLLRIDQETIAPLSPKAEKRLINNLSDVIEWCQVVAISDYAKGTLSDELLTALITEARCRGIPVIVDPKGLDFSKYTGATLLKPNLSEAYAATGAEEGMPLAEVAALLQQQVKTDALMITRSGEGISLWEKGKEYHSPARVREVVDVTGAGDTVLASIALGMGYGLSIADSADLANIAAGLSVEKLGCACIGKRDIARQILLTEKVGKLVNHEHHHLLKEALSGKGRDPIVILLDTSSGFDQESYQMLRAAKEPEVPCVVCCTEVSPDPSVLEMVASLHEVDHLVVAPESFIKSLEPRRVLRLECMLA